MGKKRLMLPAEEVDFSSVKYEREVIQAPHLTGFALKLFVKLVELPLAGSLIISFLKKQNGLAQLLQNTVIPEEPLFKPEFPPQEPETGVVPLDEDGQPEERVQMALKCLRDYDPSSCSNKESTSQFRYWRIRDYAHAYRSGIATPSMVAEHIISVIEDYNNKKPPAPLLISFDAREVRKQAAASTERFEKGIPLSVLDGIFVAIKDDIDCYPHPSKGGTTWLHEVRPVEEDAVSVSRLRSCGVIFVGKANMHELGMGTTGSNPNYGTTRNPYADERYTGGSSSGPAAIVASGVCSAALGTDGGGSVRIPSSLCGVVGLKTTHGRTDLKGSLVEGGTVTIIGPIASNVEDLILIYSALLGSSPADRISMKPPRPCLPDLSSFNSSTALGSLQLGKYAEWFNDVNSTEISNKCDDILNLLSETHGCKITDIVIPELHEMRSSHLVTIGSEMLSAIYQDYLDGKRERLTYDSRISMALFLSFTASDYIAAQSLRQRLMHYHMEIFKKVDFIVTPTTGMTAPVIPRSAVKHGETDIQVTAYLMRFVIAANLLGLPAISIPVGDTYIPILQGFGPLLLPAAILSSLDLVLPVWAVCYLQQFSLTQAKEDYMGDGYDKNGLPIGLQLIGRPWSEASILRLASAIEELCEGSRKRPASFYDVLRKT